MELSAWDAAAVAIKALLYAATLCAAGGVFFTLYSASLISPGQRRRIRRWVGLCVGVALVASAVRIAIIAGSMGEGVVGVFDGDMVRMVLQAGEGRATGIRLAGLLIVGTTAVIDRRGSMLALLGALLAATSFAWIGHAWAANHRGLSVLLLSVHLTAVAFWLGALLPLLLVGRHEEFETCAPIVTRFGQIAVYGVGLVLLAGALLLCTFLSHFAELWTTGYGRLVSLKLAGVAMLLGAAALNKLRFTPRLQAHDRSALLGLRRSIQVEMLLAAIILAITASLTSLVGPSLVTN